MHAFAVRVEERGDRRLGQPVDLDIGVQLAQPDRPVVCVVGEGSAQYAITAFWTAAAYRVPVTFLVLQGIGEYDFVPLVEARA